jgi:hypothetical protein
MSNFNQGYIEAKRKQRDAIRKRMKDFIAKGGKVKQIKTGVMTNREAA